jgi:hypothetical protein
MRRTELSISALPAWAKLNDVLFYDIRVENIEGRGFGLVAERAMSSEETFDVPALLRLPKDLVLSAETIEEHARADKHFRELLSAAGGVVGHVPYCLAHKLRNISLREETSYCFCSCR